MAGGSWTSQNKVRPGVYINFMGKQVPLTNIGDRGIVALPMAIGWGAVNKLMTVDYTANIQELFGLPASYEKILPLREALKRAVKVLVYNIIDENTAAANAEIGNLLITAVQNGISGNDIKVSVVKEAETYYVKTYFGANQEDEQKVIKISDLRDNEFVKFGKKADSDELTATPSADGTALSKGESQIGTGENAKKISSYGDVPFTGSWLPFEGMNFNTMALCTNDDAVKSSFVTWIKNIRAQEGKHVQGVVSNYNANNEGIISVKNGVVLSDGTALTAAQAAAWVAGATAGAGVNESLTYTTYDGAVGITEYLPSSKIEEALNAGQIVFVESGGKARLEQDINTLTEFTKERSKIYRKNRVVRVQDSIANDIRSSFENSFIGKVNNDADGRNLFKADIIAYMDALQKINAVQNFNPDTDVFVEKGNDSDSIVVSLGVQPVDAVEKIYMTVELQ